MVQENRYFHVFVPNVQDVRTMSGILSRRDAERYRDEVLKRFPDADVGIEEVDENGSVRMRPGGKHLCPDHEQEMRFSATLWDFPEDLVVDGIEFRNQFYYCPVGGCPWHYSGATGDIRLADLVELVASGHLQA